MLFVKLDVLPDDRAELVFAIKLFLRLTVAPEIIIPLPAVKLVDTVLVVPEVATDIPVPADTVVIELASIDCFVTPGLLIYLNKN